MLWYHILLFPVDTVRVLVLYYQPSCQNYFHIAIVFKFVMAKVMLSALETVDNRPAPLEGCSQDFPFFC
jgi:hypothetical protein